MVIVPGPTSSIRSNISSSRVVMVVIYVIVYLSILVALVITGNIIEIVAKIIIIIKTTDFCRSTEKLNPRE